MTMISERLTSENKSNFAAILKDIASGKSRKNECAWTIAENDNHQVCIKSEWDGDLLLIKLVKLENADGGFMTSLVTKESYNIKKDMPIPEIISCLNEFINKAKEAANEPM